MNPPNKVPPVQQLCGQIAQIIGGRDFELLFPTGGAWVGVFGGTKAKAMEDFMAALLSYLRATRASTTAAASQKAEGDLVAAVNAWAAKMGY